MQDKETSLLILSRMVNEIDCPVTAKIRIFNDYQETVEFVQRVEECGVQMITVHGRTLAEKNRNVKEANWSIIKAIKKCLNIPVVANGGIGCYSDISTCLDITSADGVMSSEALLENPKLFCAEGDIKFRNNYVSSQLETAQEYLSLIKQHPIPRKAQTVSAVKSHLFKMLYRFIVAPRNYDLRNALGRCESLDTVEDIFDEVGNRFNMYCDSDKRAVSDGYLNVNTWYDRHKVQTFSEDGEGST